MDRRPDDRRMLQASSKRADYLVSMLDKTVALESAVDVVAVKSRRCVKMHGCESGEGCVPHTLRRRALQVNDIERFVRPQLGACHARPITDQSVSLALVSVRDERVGLSRGRVV